MISSIFKFATFSALPVLLITGCAEKKIKPLPETILQEKVTSSFVATPTPAAQMKFADKTAEYGLEKVKGVHLYAADVDLDGDSDLITLEDFVDSPKFYFFDKKIKKFIPGYNPFNEIIRASYLNFIDLDHDEVLDVIVGNLNQKSELSQYPVRLYKGFLKDGKISYQLKNVLQTGVLPTASVVAGDFNLDGEIDLYLANWFNQNEEIPKPVPDTLLYGKGFSFTNVSYNLKGEYDKDKGSGLFINAAPTFGASICDVDKNGFADILTSTSNGYFNKLWLNLDGESFQDYGLESGYAADNEGTASAKAGGNSFFSLCGDYNNDTLVDIVSGNLFRESDPEYRDKSAILSGSTRSFPPKFYRTEIFEQNGKVGYAEGLRRGLWIDYNLDGLNDLILANSGFPPDSRLMFFEQEADHAFEERSGMYGLDLLNPSGMITLDLNNDGMMDFISGQTNVRAASIEQRIYVFENQSERKNLGSVRFFLEGRRSNSRGLSSTVALNTNKKRRLAFAEYASGSLPSQNEEGLYFAFRDEIPQEVEVRWSFGTEDRLGRVIPLLKKYKLPAARMKAKHTEFNLCDDGRILPRIKHCYR